MLDDGRPQWDTAQNAWMVWDPSAQKWLKLIVAKHESGLRSLLVGIGAISIALLAMFLLAQAVR